MTPAQDAADTPDPADDDSGDLTERTLTMRAPLGPAQAPLRLAHFLVLSNDGATTRHRIGPAGLTIGRVPGNDIVVPAPEISRRHCRVELDGAAALLSDLGSTNGTFMGGRRLDRATRLRNGAAFAAGKATFRYEQRDEREVAEEGELAAELRAAADYVRAILPEPLTAGPVQADWWFVPSSRLGGDAFGYQFLTETLFAGFVLDVSGHGIGSAMHAANVANALRRRALPGVDFADPASVAAGLNTVFPMEDHNGLMLTLWYFVYDTETRLLRFCAAGHHPSFLAAPGAADLLPLWLKSPAIGMLPRGTWQAGRADIPPGSRLYIFSDGAFEIVSDTGGQWVLEDLRRIMSEPEQPGLAESQRIYQAVRAAARPGPLGDDFSALVIRFP